ncbi:MAG: hypothetical protein HC908_02565 [Calothrix sp. SM1_7_51]|nr:hypothetical protein [Calothrix sp. SM1_7_51]
MPTSTTTISNTEIQSNRAWEISKSCYQQDQQVKFQDLQAEVDLLLQELQSLKVKRSTQTSQRR